MRRTIKRAALPLLIAVGVTALSGAATITPAGAADNPADVTPIIVGPYQPYDGITAVSAVSPPGTTLTVRFVVFDLPPGVQALTPESLNTPQTVRAIVDATLSNNPNQPTPLDPGPLHGCDVEEQADLVPATPAWLALNVGDTVTVPIPEAFAASAEHLNDSCAAPPPAVAAPPPPTTVPPVAPPVTTTTAPTTPVSEPTLSCLTDRCETLTVASVPAATANETGVEAAVATRAPLPVTGTQPGPMILGGLLLLLLGAACLQAARRNMAAGR